MKYIWQEEKSVSGFKLPIKEIGFKVENMEEYETQDYPHKPDFRGQWDRWQGVEIDYTIEKSNLKINGSRGKTVWYIPAKSEKEAKALNIQKGQALKIVKYLVSDNLEEEYERLIEEVEIQNNLADSGLAPKVYNLILLRNVKENSVKWFDEVYFHPRNSIYFTLVVEHIEAEAFPKDGIKIDENYMFEGYLIDNLNKKCKELDIIPYDLGLGNIFYSKGSLKVIDIHKWKMKNLDYRKLDRAPTYLQIELNNTCNAKCKMCTIPNMKRKRGYMSDELYEKILRQANDLNVSYIMPFLHGEPFLRKDIIDKMKMINDLAPNAKIHLFTNASYLTNKNVDQLKEISNLDLISYSFPGGTKDVYKKITGLDFENTVNNIKYSLKELNIKSKITMPLIKDNKHTIEDFHKLWEGYCQSIGKDADIHVYDTYNYLGNFPESLAKETDTVCDRILRSMTILWDGRVGLCCMDAEGDYILGNVNRQSLYDIWNGEKAMGYRRKHLISRKNCEPCDRCNQELIPESIKE